MQNSNREWITCIACICTDNSALSPGLIYQATTGNIQDSWLQDFNPAEHNAFFASSSSGWTNNNLGLHWLQQVFNKETKKKTRRAYRLLILDGHGSHVSMRFIDYCNQNRILLAVYPPYLTHTLQPLDVCLFGPLATAYSDKLASFIYESMAFTALKKRDFFRLFNKAWETLFTKKNILSGFEACGLEPFNPERVLARFSTTTGRPSSSEGSQSALTAQEWRRIEELFRSVVSDIYDQQAKQLSNTIHSLSMKVMTLEMENQGYIKSLANAKKKRKPSKALLLKPPEQYHSGAVFYSPRKVQQARDQQAEKDAATELVHQQKDEETRRKEAEKHGKARIAEERKHMRAAAKEAQV